MTSIEARARAKLEKAERKAGSLSMTMTTGGVGGVVSRLYNSLFNTLGGGGGGGDNSEACELYTEAANLFKAARMWTEAGDAFLRCAALNESGQREDRYDAAASYSEAGNCFRKVDVKVSHGRLLWGIRLGRIGLIHSVPPFRRPSTATRRRRHSTSTRDASPQLRAFT
jgi:hypothetical protein